MDQFLQLEILFLSVTVGNIFSMNTTCLYSDIRRSCVHLASFIPSNVPSTSICLAVLVWYRMADWIAIERAWSNEIRIILRWLMFDEEKGRWCGFLELRSNCLERRNVHASALDTGFKSDISNQSNRGDIKLFFLIKLIMKE